VPPQISTTAPDRYHPGTEEGNGVNDAQAWALIAGFLAVMVAMSGLLLRVVQAEIAAGVTPLAAEIARLGVKVDRLDKDVQRVANRLLDNGPGTI
jgi:hypothetical protein